MTRPILNAVRFDAKSATLTATDTYIAAQVPCKVEKGDESGIVPAAALKEADGKSLRIADGKAVLKLPDGERSWDLLEGTYPDAVDKVLAETPLANPIGLNSVLLPAEKFAARLAYYGGRCAYCGAADAPHMDHAIRVATSACFPVINLVPACTFTGKPPQNSGRRHDDMGEGFLA